MIRTAYNDETKSLELIVTNTVDGFLIANTCRKISDAGFKITVYPEREEGYNGEMKICVPLAEVTYD